MDMSRKQAVRNLAYCAEQRASAQRQLIVLLVRNSDSLDRLFATGETLEQDDTMVTLRQHDTPFGVKIDAGAKDIKVTLAAFDEEASIMLYDLNRKEQDELWNRASEVLEGRHDHPQNALDGLKPKAEE